jgi:prepilin-type N-terminal cleavage/methylation domain-containing protein
MPLPAAVCRPGNRLGVESRSCCKPLLISSGFTIIELIIVMVLLGVLVAAIATRVPPGFLGSQGIAAQVAVDQAVADIQYAQMRAMGSAPGNNVSVQFNGTSSYTISGTGFSEVRTFSGSPAVGTQTFTFNTLGEMTVTGNPAVSVGGRTITVYSVTGKAVVS